MASKTLRRLILFALAALLGLPLALSATQDDAAAELLPLHAAIEAGDVAEVKRLIEAGADVNAKNSKGWVTPHLAVESADKRDSETLIYRDFSPLRFPQAILQGACALQNCASGNPHVRIVR